MKKQKSVRKEVSKSIKIGIVTSRFNEEITQRLEEGTIDYLESLTEPQVEILSVRVPGAVEIPIACQALIQKGCDGIVALGAVIRGETTHYEAVCNSVERGVTHLMLETQVPIGFGVLMTENEEQALDRVGGAHGHKGEESAQAVVEMVGLLNDLRSSKDRKKKKR